MPNYWWHDRGTYPREGVSISLGRRMRLTRGATCEQCASLECGVCEAWPRHSVAPSGAHMYSAAQGPSRWTVPDDSTTAKDIWPTREKVPASYLPRLHNP